MMVVEKERSIEERLLQLKNQNDDSDCRITACVILSTFVAVGYTSGAEIGIMKDLGLTIAQVILLGIGSWLVGVTSIFTLVSNFLS